MKLRALTACAALFLCAAIFVSAQEAQAEDTDFAQNYGYADDLVYGLEAYKNKDWSNALFFLRKASAVKETSSEEVWLLMISAEMNVNDYHAVLRDTELFMRRFSSSIYIPNIEYQRSLARFGLGLYEEAAKGFSDFCENYPSHVLMPSALFWAGESLYSRYEYAQAMPLYTRVVTEYEGSDKYAESLYRIELLKQREREEKLLYLLRVTGEEAASAREEYERHIKRLQSEEAISLKRRIRGLEEQVSALQTAYEEEKTQKEELNTKILELLSANEQLSAEISDSQKAAAERAAAELAAKKRADLIRQKTQAPLSPEELAELKRKAAELEKLLHPRGGV
ncbi:tetratricopeptide repeat protein [Treponema sp. HNW]|uniref:tetratricopeptide repeat protein n=1 Tax=Treponema sp. HNW TaxID=3116654 RepID=UPI003D15340B